MGFIIYYLIQILNSMGRILVRWKSFRNNLEMLCHPMGWLQLVGSLKSQVSFAKDPYKRGDILPKRPIILRSLLIVAIPYQIQRGTHKQTFTHTLTHIHTSTHTNTHIDTYTHLQGMDPHHIETAIKIGDVHAYTQTHIHIHTRTGSRHTHIYTHTNK